MFFKQLHRQTKQDRQENGLYYSSLVIAIMAFYTLLSLPRQDVMLYLRTLESQALSKLFTLIPLIFFCRCLSFFSWSIWLQKRRWSGAESSWDSI
ncbi:hypothetical protein HCH52_08610 [Oscillospiraceae bacterium HV4-5-C5C]|nr:hypothetical protein [Oscillospiraceae bacterium HV4-5-C5C]